MSSFCIFGLSPSLYFLQFYKQIILIFILAPNFSQPVFQSIIRSLFIKAWLSSRFIFFHLVSGTLAMNVAAAQDAPLVGIIMGSQSDWATLEYTANMLKQLGVPFEAEVVSAHRTPDRLFEYAETARDRGIQVIIAGAGGAAHLPGMCAAKTDLPVLGVPVKSSILNGVDSLLSIVQMPAGIAVGTLAIGPAGATNAAIMAAQILGLTRPEIAKNVADFRAAQTDKVASNNIPGQA